MSHIADSTGEISLIYIDGRRSHSILRPPALSNDASRPAGQPGPQVLVDTSEHIAVTADGVLQATEQLACHGRRLLYARIDLVPSPSGPVVMEAEIIEPTLFLRAYPAAAMTLAQAAVNLLRGGLSSATTR
jgi:hypothetical protein